MFCGLCGDELESENWNDIDGVPYCHNSDWTIYEGTCWEQVIVAGTPMEEWLTLCWECDGCEPDESGECTCVN